MLRYLQNRVAAVQTKPFSLNNTVSCLHDLVFLGIAHPETMKSGLAFCSPRVKDLGAKELTHLAFATSQFYSLHKGFSQDLQIAIDNRVGYVAEHLTEWQIASLVISYAKFHEPIPMQGLGSLLGRLEKSEAAEKIGPAVCSELIVGLGKLANISAKVDAGKLIGRLWRRARSHDCDARTLCRCLHTFTATKITEAALYTEALTRLDALEKGFDDMSPFLLVSACRALTQTNSKDLQQRLFARVTACLLKIPDSTVRPTYLKDILVTAVRLKADFIAIDVLKLFDKIATLEPHKIDIADGLLMLGCGLSLGMTNSRSFDVLYKQLERDRPSLLPSLVSTTSNFTRWKIGDAELHSKVYARIKKETLTATKRDIVSCTSILGAAGVNEPRSFEIISDRIVSEAPQFYLEELVEAAITTCKNEKNSCAEKVAAALFQRMDSLNTANELQKRIADGGLDARQTYILLRFLGRFAPRGQRATEMLTTLCLALNTHANELPGRYLVMILRTLDALNLSKGQGLLSWGLVLKNIGMKVANLNCVDIACALNSLVSLKTKDIYNEETTKQLFSALITKRNLATLQSANCSIALNAMHRLGFLDKECFTLLCQHYILRPSDPSSLSVTIVALSRFRGGYPPEDTFTQLVERVKEALQLVKMNSVDCGMAIVGLGCFRTDTREFKDRTLLAALFQRIDLPTAAFPTLTLVALSFAKVGGLERELRTVLGVATAREKEITALSASTLLYAMMLSGVQRGSLLTSCIARLKTSLRRPGKASGRSTVFSFLSLPFLIRDGLEDKELTELVLRSILTHSWVLMRADELIYVLRAMAELGRQRVAENSVKAICEEISRRGSLLSSQEKENVKLCLSVLNLTHEQLKIAIEI